ncbi:flagellar hook-associated protein FlgK [Schinkia azotoformans]|uniref:flagellar hook-associated protein FlgK n=1 Tax=Schinkia azotoformans TaxID=1454 RepID=UPI002E22ACE2|nr:flagellar hook-associated protein FlgK [Schinkia azotoformans]
MVSTFHGLETARRGMMTQQAALYVTGHNIANANTPGYTRQRVNFETTEPYPPASRNRPQIPGQMGTGVQAGDIQRIRDSFVDTQFRGENSKLGFWQAKAEMLTQMEDIMNEPSDTGLAKSMDEFWNSLQDLAVQPQNNGARRVVRQRGIALANTFNYMYNSLKAVQKDYRNEIDISETQINSLLRQINQLNKQIGSIEPHGYLPNDLYDERDRLVDELSSLVNIKVEVKPSGGLASANAEGLYDIYLATPQGDKLKDSDGKEIQLVNTTDGKAYGIHIKYEDRTVLDSPVSEIRFFELKETEKGFVGLADDAAADDDNATPVYELSKFSSFNTNGRLKGFIEGYGYKEGTDTKGLYNDMLSDLDKMAFTFAEQFNLVHQSGWSLNEIRDGVEHNYDFFDLGGLTADNPVGAAALIKVAQAIMDDVDNIAAAAEGNVIAGSMERTSSVDSKTVGNPSIKGVYDRTKTTPALSVDAKEIKVELSFDEASNSWSYKLTSYKSDGTTLDTLPGVTIGASGKISIYGIDIDTTLVKPKDDDSGTQTWTYTFPAEGVKPSDEAFIGNGSNALELSKVKDALLNYGGSLTNVTTFYQGMIGSLGDQASEALRMLNTSTTLKDSVEQRRMSISNVSLDEEMTNMIKFQHAYNAAARQITLIDEMLDKIINGMGLVGR